MRQIIELIDHDAENLIDDDLVSTYSAFGMNLTKKERNASSSLSTLSMTSVHLLLSASIHRRVAFFHEKNQRGFSNSMSTDVARCVVL